MAKEGKTDFENACQQNLMKIAEYLAADVFKITTAQEIADALGITKSKAYWTLKNLAIRGWVDEQGDGWRLSPRLVKIADSVRANFGENVKRYLGGSEGG